MKVLQREDRTNTRSRQLDLLVLIKWLAILMLTYCGPFHPCFAQRTISETFIDRLTGNDVLNGLIAGFNVTASPGVSGINFTVDDEFSETDLEYSKNNIVVDKNFGAFELGKADFSIYSHFAFGALNVKNAFTALTQVGESISVDTNKDILSGILGLGLNFKLPHHLKFKPFVSVAFSSFDTQVAIIGEGFDPDDLNTAQKAAFLDTDAKAWTIAPTLELKYDRWLDAGRIEIEGAYSYAYTDIFDASTQILEASGGTDIVRALTRWTAPTGQSVFSTPLYWNVFGAYTDFVSLGQFPLGFNDYFQFGAGLSFHLKKKIFGFTIDFVGVEFSALVGEDLTGWNWSIIVRD
jgi:hypothetical protein